MKSVSLTISEFSEIQLLFKIAHEANILDDDTVQIEFDNVEGHVVVDIGEAHRLLATLRVIPCVKLPASLAKDQQFLSRLEFSACGLEGSIDESQIDFSDS